MQWILTLLLATLVSATPALAAPAATQTKPKPGTQQAQGKQPQGKQTQAAPARTSRGAIVARGGIVHPAAAHGARVARGGISYAVARPQMAHPGLGGDGSEAANFCGNMMMPAEALREVSRGMSRGHAGLDLMAPHGSPIRAAAAGTVIYAGWYYAYGNMVDIRHADGVVTRYAHMSAMDVDVGSVVQAGDEIGKVGATGRASGPHVHFEVRVDGRAMDPKPYLALASCNGVPAQEEILEAFAGEPRRPATRARKVAARPQTRR